MDTITTVSKTECSCKLSGAVMPRVGVVTHCPGLRLHFVLENNLMSVLKINNETEKIYG